MFICKGLGSQVVGVKQKLELVEDERKRRRRRGGLEQGQSKCLKEVESSLANRMLDLWGKGKLSGAAMQAMHGRSSYQRWPEAQGCGRDCFPG